MTTKKRHKHVKEMLKRLADPKEDAFVTKLRIVLEGAAPEDLGGMLRLMRLFHEDRSAAEVFAQYARRYKSVVLELEPEDLRELQDFVRVQAVHNS